MKIGVTITSLCDSCTNIGCEFQSGIVRTKCAFYIPDNCGNHLGVDYIERNSIKYYPGPSGLGSYFWCSNCDRGIYVREWHRNHYNYCPNCGAKMIEPHESEVNK